MVTKTAAKQKALLYNHEQTTQKHHWILLLLCMHQYFFYGSTKYEVLALCQCAENTSYSSVPEAR